MLKVYTGEIAWGQNAYQYHCDANVFRDATVVVGAAPERQCRTVGTTDGGPGLAVSEAQRESDCCASDLKVCVGQLH